MEKNEKDGGDRVNDKQELDKTNKSPTKGNRNHSDNNINNSNIKENNYFDDYAAEEEEEDEDFAGEESKISSESEEGSEISDEEEIVEEDLLDLYEEAKDINEDFQLLNEDDESFTDFIDEKHGLQRDNIISQNNIQSNIGPNNKYMLRRKRKRISEANKQLKLGK